MLKQYFQQAFAQLRQHPLISAVSVVGTALSIFLIMLVVMLQQVKTAPFAPERHRDRFLHAKFCSIVRKSTGGESNGPMSVNTARELFQSLKTPEAVTIYTSMCMATPVSLPGTAASGVDMRETDDRFWQVFDFSFVDGKPYDRATFDAGLPVAVITEGVARLLFGTTACSGREFLLNHAPYKVSGVVKDVSTLATTAYSQVWIPFTSTSTANEVWSEHMGLMSATLLARSRKDFPTIREEADRRLAEFNKVIGENGWKIISRNRPYDQETQVIAFSANQEPDLPAERRSRFIIFAILLIVPAINLSSMTQSRLRQRISEIGVRRAFGCTRLAVLGQILTENLIITLMAGVLGLLVSVAFAFWGSELLFAQAFSYVSLPPKVDAAILLHASTFLWALFFCFVLNLLSTGLPAWRASRLNIVSAIGGKLH